jgi:hypothetical protein
MMSNRTTIPTGAHAASRRPRGVPALALLYLVALACAAVVCIVYVLWPRWPTPAVALETPELPITIASVAFKIPAAAIRVPVQRRDGAQDRLDLAFLWPSLAPPESRAPPAPEGSPDVGKVPARIFLTITAAGDTLSPAERLRNIYPRYASLEPVAGPRGLAVLAFRDGSPYQGEDLIYDAAMPQNFLVRCTRNAATPGTCLYQRRIETADLVARFPRDWLDDWRALADNIDRLIARLHPSGPKPAR